MTIRAYFEKALVDNGLWPNEATDIMNAVEADKVAESMRGRWKEDTSAYPPQLLGVTRMTVWHVADKWLAANKPEHWARPVFNAEMLAELEGKSDSQTAT